MPLQKIKFLGSCGVELDPILQRKMKNLCLRKLLRNLSTWTFLHYWCNISPSTLPVPRLNQIPWLLPIGLNSVLLLPSLRADGATCGISDVMRHELGAEMCRQDTNTSGHTPQQDFRPGGLPQKLGYLLIFGGWVQFLLSNSVFVYQCLYYLSKAT